MKPIAGDMGREFVPRWVAFVNLLQALAFCAALDNELNVELSDGTAIV